MTPGAPRAVSLAAAAWVLVMFCSIAAGLARRPLDIDEAWIGEQAWFFARDGFVHSDLFAGYEGSEDRILVYHRLLVWIGASAVRLIGFGLVQLRLVSFSAAAILLALMAGDRTASRARSRSGPPAVLLSIALFYRFSGIYRPEILLALLAWAQWSLVLRAARSGASLPAISAGVACGLGILAHLNGIAFAAGSATVLLMSGRRRLLFPFAAAALAVGFGPLAEAAGHPVLFWHQFTGEFVRTKTSLAPLAPWWNLVREHQRLFRDPGMILLTLATASAVLCAPAGRNAENPYFYPFALSSLLALAALTGSKSAKYAIPMMPFMASEIWCGIEEAARGWRVLPAWRRWPVMVSSALLFSHGAASAMLAAISRPESPSAENREAGSLIPDGATVVAPVGFIFDEIGRLRICGLYLAERQGGGPLTPGRLLEYAAAREASFVVLDSTAASALGPLPESIFARLGSGYPAVYRLGPSSAD